MKILAINAGSTSIKFKLFDLPSWLKICSGSISNIGKNIADIIFYNKDRSEKSSRPIYDHHEGLNIIIDYILNPDFKIIKDKNEITAIGHRVVHIGRHGSRSRVINNRIIGFIEEFSEVAPLHNPSSLSCIRYCMAYFKNAINIGVFDTTFHKDIPQKAFLYPLPYEYYLKYEVRKFGFHGIAYEYITGRACGLLGMKIKNSKIIALMLGGGSSVIAFKNGKTIDTSMGFTPSGGCLPMSTRSGDIDPGLVLYLANKRSLSIQEIYSILSQKSGMLGLSEKYSDFLSIENGKMKNDIDCSRAFDVYTYLIKKYIGSCIAAMNGVDLIVFGGGIGSSSPLTRQAILSDMDYLGIVLDEKKNASIACEEIISRSNSKVKIMVVNVDEELIIAREAFKSAARYLEHITSEQ